MINNGLEIIKTGLITKGIGGLYHVLTADGVYMCSARGVFRNTKKTRSARPITPLVGDKADILVENETGHTGTIHAIAPRINKMVRPAVANVDQVIIIVSAAQPAFHPGLLDRFLVLAAHAGIDAVVCVNKLDLLSEEKTAQSRGFEMPFLPYSMAGYKILFTSVKNTASDTTALDPLRAVMAGKITVFAGPSGVGKTSLINALLPLARLEVGEISTKLKRGKHTTRAAEILPLGATPEDGFVVDTPGFSSLETEAIPARDIAGYFKEFVPFANQCKFNDCLHGPRTREADCAVKAQVRKTIHPARYDSYVKMLEK